MRDIKDYEGLYAITEDGQVWSYKSNKFLNLEKSSGYLRVALFKDGKRKKYLVHRLVAEAYIPNLSNLPCVNHKDEDKTNNNISNLEWCTYSYNNQYGARLQNSIKAHSKKVKQMTMNGEFIKIWDSAAEAGRRLGICGVYKAANGSRKSAGGYRWEYV